MKTSGSANLANVKSDGVRITNHANMNLVINNIISFNDGNGVALSDVNNATVAGNTLRRYFMISGKETCVRALLLPMSRAR